MRQDTQLCVVREYVRAVAQLCVVREYVRAVVLR